MRNLILITAIFLLSVSYGFSQSYDIVTNDGETVNTCSGTFTQGSYTVGETYTFTVCSDDALDHHVEAFFDSHSFTTGTELCVYDGQDDTAPQLVCWDENTTGTVAAYASNTNSSGCLTFVFTAGASGATFSADFSCQFICQAPMSVDIVSSEPEMVTDGDVDYINVCWDEENNQSNDVTLTAEGTYPDNTGYPLDDSNVTFTWEFNDGTPPQSGVGLTTVTHNFPARQGYTVTVTIEDSQGCTNTNSMTQRIRVSRAPVWDDANTYVDPDAICMGEEVEMCAAYSAEEWNSSITPTMADTVDLPDGTGVCYDSDLMQNQFLPEQTLESVNDLNAIAMNIEHSYLGDLTIEIQCPNGQSVLLEEQAGGGTYLGEPIEDTDDPDNSEPGVGYWYHITPNGSQTLAEASDSYSTLPEGQYASFESLSGLVGCPLNGQWTITICDNYNIDDGYIFGWYLDFDESLFPETWSYTPDYSPVSWDGTYGVEIDPPADQNCATGTYLTTGTPDVNSDQPFIFTLEDDFGCLHDTSMNVTVYNENDPNCCVTPTVDAGDDDVVCSLSTTLGANTPASENDGYWEMISGPGTATFTDDTNPTSDVTVDTYGEYEFQWTEQYLGNPGCAASDEVIITFAPTLDPTITPIPDMCVSDDAVELEMVSQGTITSSPDINDEISNGIIDPNELGPGVYTITNTVDGPCISGDNPSEITFEIYDEIQITDFNDQECINAQSEFITEWTVIGWDGTPTSNYSVNGSPQSNSNFYETHSSPGSYSYTITDNNGCSLIEISGFRDCGCPSPGTMESLELVTLCENECTGGSVMHNMDTVLVDGTEVFEFIIHDGDNDNPLAYSSTPDFCRSDFGGDYNEIYYVSAVIGYDTNSSGHVEAGESCYSVTPGTPVMWRQNPIADAGPGDETCGLQLSVTGNEVPDGMTGYWTSDCDFSAVQGTSINDNEMTALASDYGTCTFTWHISNGNCVGEDDVVLEFNQTPNAFAGDDTITCGTEIDLTVENSLPGTNFEWSGNANFNPETGASTTASVGGPGTYQFTLTEYNGDCSDDDQVLVTFIQGPQPTINTTVDSVCGSQYNLNVENVNGPGQWTAYDEEGTQIYPTFDDDTSPTAQVTVPNWDGTFRTVEFVWTETNTYQGVSCSEDVSCEITFAKEVFAYVGDDDEAEVCGNEYTFEAETSGFGSNTQGSWIIKDVIGTFSPDDETADATFTMTSMGSYGDSAHVTFPAIWSVSNGVCSALDTVNITFYKEPEAFAGNDDSICGLQYQLDAIYDLPDNESYTADGDWNAVSGNPSTANFTDESDPSTNVNVNSPGIYQFIWRENNSLSASCNDRDTVTIEFKEKPVISAGEDFDVCGNETDMNATSAGFEGTWLSEPGISYDNSENPNTGISYGSYGTVELVWQEANEECTSTDAVEVTFWRKPTAELAMDPADTAVCGKIFDDLRAENPGSGVDGNWISSPSNGVEFLTQSYNETVEVSNYGYYDFQWVESNHPDNEPPEFCSDSTDPWTIHFIEVPEADAGPDSIYCGLEGELQAELSVETSTGEWDSQSSNITIDPNSDPNATVISQVYTETASSPYDFFELVWTENNFGCTNSDAVEVRFARIPSSEMTIIPPRCFGEAASIKANEDQHPEYDWELNNGIVDSIWPPNSEGGEYRRLVRWPDGDTAHIIGLEIVSEHGCRSSQGIDTIFEPGVPGFDTEVFPDTCLLGKGAVKLIPDSLDTAFEWVDTTGTGITNVNDTVQYNLPANEYRIAHVYRTMNTGYIPFYEDVFGSENCRDTFNVQIDTVGMIVADFEVAPDVDVNSLVAPEAEVWFNNLSDEDELRTTNVWHFDDGESETNNDEQVEHIYTEPRDCYQPYLVVYARNLPQCRDTAYMDCIKVDDRSSLEVPNIFTPNGDGQNDFFQVEAKTLETFQGKVVNRWGNTIYEWENYQDEEAGWDGKLPGGSDASPGVYFYIITATGIDGYEYELTGPFHLTR